MTDPSIASPDEVLQALTAALRGPKTAESLRAAEQLAKHFGLLAPREDAPDRGQVALEIEDALRAMRRKRNGSRRS